MSFLRFVRALIPSGLSCFAGLCLSCPLRSAEPDEPKVSAPKPGQAERAARNAKVAEAAAAHSKLAAWVEPNFPFFSSILDARKSDPAMPENNLTPRGLILNLGQDCWACFDTDLLRMSAIWRGKGVTPKALAPGSYFDLTTKTNGGQGALPRPAGTLWIANGLYPGWQEGDALALVDPREPAPSPEEIGRGPLTESLGRFNVVRLIEDGVALEYLVAGTAVREQTTVVARGSEPVIERRFEVGASTHGLRLVLGRSAPGVMLSLGQSATDEGAAQLESKEGLWTVRVGPRPRVLEFSVAIGKGDAPPSTAPGALSRRTAAVRWPQAVATTVARSNAKEAYVVDEIALPENNPWRRGVRPGDIQFFKDGTGALVTLDGDVWLVRGLGGEQDKPTWRRFASGLHEPMSLAIRDEELFVFDKNGIWRLRDTNGDGEADAYEMFSNAFGQTADQREFPATLRVAPGGEFVIAKGGQEATYQGKHNGSVLRISADGRRTTVLGYGFRQPSIGVNPRTGLVTASDQEGPYVPSTPLHIVRDHQFYGFLPPFKPKEVYPSPPAEPLTWFPHSILPSAISQTWLYGAKMGPLNDALIQIAFNKPEIFRVLLNQRSARLQAAVVSVTQAFKYPPLNGSVNPADGQLYLAGFQVLGWGNVVDVTAGLGRVRYTGAPVTLPREVVPMTQGVLVRFDVALDRQKATDPASFSLQSWAYQRSSKYGSPQFKADGQPGQDALVPSSAYLSKDGKSVFIGVPGMKPVMQLRVGWSLATAEGHPFDENAYTTPYELSVFDSQAEGFGDIVVDLTPRAAAVQAGGPVSVEEGKRLAQLFACAACHATEFNAIAVRSGPPWKGLYGSDHAVFIDGKPAKVTADEAYLRESILNPTAKIAEGFEKGEYAMPSFAGVLNDAQIASLILYIQSLQ